MIIDRHLKPFQHLWRWHCHACNRGGSWHSSRDLAQHEADRHVCLPDPRGVA